MLEGDVQNNTGNLIFFGVRDTEALKMVLDEGNTCRALKIIYCSQKQEKRVWRISVNEAQLNWRIG